MITKSLRQGKGRKAAIMPQGKSKATAVQRVIMTPGKGKTTAAMPATTTQGKGKAAAAPDKAAAAPDKAAVASLLAAARALPVPPSLQVVMSPTVPVPMQVPAPVLARVSLQTACSW